MRMNCVSRFEVGIMVIDRSGEVNDAAINGWFFQQVFAVEVADGGEVVAMHIIAGNAHDAVVGRGRDREAGLGEPEDIGIAIKNRSFFGFGE